MELQKQHAERIKDLQDEVGMGHDGSKPKPRMGLKMIEGDSHVITPTNMLVLWWMNGLKPIRYFFWCVGEVIIEDPFVSICYLL